MPKAVASSQGGSGTTYGTYASAGDTAAPAVPVTVVFVADPKNAASAVNK